MEKVLLFVFTASALHATCSSRQYHFIYEPKTWADAQSFCREKYTDLVTVDSLDVVKILNEMVNLDKMGSPADAWIGLFEDVQSWRWSLEDDAFYQDNGTQYRNWIPGTPDNFHSNEPCTEMSNTGEWNDLPCELTRKPICITVEGQTATFTGINLLMTWAEAQSYCRAHYTDLASVRNAEENSKALAAKLTDEWFWMGLYRDTWKWSDGDGDMMSYWSGNQPLGSTEHCATAYFSDAGRWRDWLCHYSKPFICHHDPPLTKHVMKVKLARSSAVDLNNAAVQTGLLNELKQKLQEHGMEGNITLSWRTQMDGEIFHRGATMDAT